MIRISYSNVLDVTAEGKNLSPDHEVLLVGGWADFGVGVPAAFQLTFRDPKRLLLSDARIKIGTEIVLAPVSAGEGAQSPLLTGEVTGVEMEYDPTGTLSVVRGYDLGHRLLRRRRVTGYRSMTASDIVRKVAGLSNVPIGTIEATKSKYEFITQANVTDWDFLCRLAEENERVLYLSAKGQLKFVKPVPASGAPPVSTPAGKSPFALTAGVEIMRCRMSVTAADQVTSVEARGWDVKAKRDLVGTSPAAANSAYVIGSTPAKAVAKFGRATLTDTGTPLDTQTQVTHAARSLADDVTAAFAEFEVTVRGNPKLRAGVPVTLIAVGDPFEGKYTVTGARHTFDAGGYSTLLTVSGRQWRSLYGLASGGAATSPRLPSVANALVTDIKDPFRQGRVKLRFPWLDDMYISDWTRTVQFGGVGGGGVIAPDVGDEVLVAFDRGALDHPYVIGGLYNGRDKPRPGDVPLYDATRGNTTRRTLADRSGNRLDLLDQRTGGKRGVRIASGDDRLTINLDRTRTEITVDSKGSVTIKGTRSVSIEAGGSLSLTAKGRLSIKSGGLLSIASGAGINIRSGALVSLNAGGALDLKAGAMTSITTGATIQLTSATLSLKAAAGMYNTRQIFPVGAPI
ncbi:VgrG-related protein [Streptomyces sp. NPDC088554]|uniref:VgrG-related protein n=1 Tax=Streptomyces sp. NPDC088554 TaxID=3365865 RepID=UPI0038039A58